MKTILVAEDDKKIGVALEIRLQAAGYKVMVLPDAFRSYLRIMNDRPDVILMDICLPMGNGLEVARELHDAGLGYIPIIFMTASRRKDLRARAEELNAVDFLEKPFDTHKLLAAISRALQAKPFTKVTCLPSSAGLNKVIAK